MIYIETDNVKQLISEATKSNNNRLESTKLISQDCIMTEARRLNISRVTMSNDNYQKMK